MNKKVAWQQAQREAKLSGVDTDSWVGHCGLMSVTSTLIELIPSLWRVRVRLIPAWRESIKPGLVGEATDECLAVVLGLEGLRICRCSED